MGWSCLEEMGNHQLFMGNLESERPMTDDSK